MTAGFALLRELVPERLHRFLFDYIVRAVDAGRAASRDPQMPGTPIIEKDPMTEALLEMLQPRVEFEAGAAMLPTYSYLRAYKRGDVLRRHLDRDACEVSVTLNIGRDAARPWPIWLETSAGPQAFELEPGDGLLYRGCEVPHWREAFDGERMIQVFLHYVERGGPRKAQAFDGRSGVGTSATARAVLASVAADGKR